ncbi:MAG: amidohydrolase family protein [Armatimonadota bacterium]
MIIDIHAHAFPDELAVRAIDKLTYGGKIVPYIGGTCDELIESMRKASVDISVIMPIATKPAQVRSINRWAAMINQKYENLICFGTLHPQQEDWRTEIDLLLADRIPGIKLHPDYQEFFVDEPEHFPMYKALADAGLLVLFHAGVDIGLPPPIHCPPDRMARVLDAVPDLTVIAAHMGGYDCWDDVDRYLVGRNLFFDTSYSLTDMGPDRMASMIRSHGAEKVLFGTDSPWTDQSAEVEGIRALNLTPDEIESVLGGNAARLLRDFI